MSLYGALYAGVAGLQAQSNKLGILSDNIANVNTIGYKEGSSQFQTLVTSQGNATAYSPGGVLGGNRQLIDTQGLLQTTTSPTDIAISGAGLFVVNQASDSSGQVLFTRAGSFTQDSQGNFVNTAGYFLQAWPLDSNGLLPGAPGNTSNTTSSANLSSLTTVNVQNVTGTASSTTNVSIGANLNAGQAAQLGAGETTAMDPNDSINANVNSTDLILPSSTDHLTRGDTFSIQNGSGTINATYTYGGFTFGRDVTNNLAAGDGDNGQNLLASPLTLAANAMQSAGSGSGDITITSASHGLAVGDVVTISGETNPVGGILANQINGSFVVKSVTANTFTITTAGADPAVGGTTGGDAGTSVVTRPFVGTILDADTANQSFLNTTGTTGFTASGLTFTINTAAAGTVTFTYTASAPNAQLGQFNNLNNLATAINDVTGLTARVVNNRLYVGAIDANAAVTFANGSTTGTDGPPVQAGIDWVRELGLADIPSSASISTTLVRFNSLQSLADDVNATTGLAATVNDPTGAATVSINLTDPLGTIDFIDNTYTGTNGSPLRELGLAGSSLLGGALGAGAGISSGLLGPAYDPTDPLKNMASGSLAAQFSRPVTVFDAQGSSHNLNIAFLKTGVNTWAVEVYAQPGTDIGLSQDGTDDGLLANGTITFNGNGTLRAVSASLTNAIAINWTNGASPSAVTLDWGTASSTDGLSQFNSDYNVNFVNQNGTPVGQLTGVSIDADGFITASFNNGETQKLYKIPLAEFTNPDALQAFSGNAFAQTSGSGVVNLKQAGSSGVGTINSGALEQSNAELANQLTDMIIAQRAYQANTKIIQTADTLLSDLDQIIQ